MKCVCTAPGHCQLLGRIQSERNHLICQGIAPGLTPEKCDVYRENWLMLAGKTTIDYCHHRGPQLRTVTCHVCGNRGKQVAIHQCDLFGECSPTQHQIGQPEKVCEHCPSRTKPLAAQWDRKIDQLIPSPDGQNFNNSLIDFHGRRIMAYRHRWGGAKLGLCELDGSWQVKWNCLLSFPSVAENRHQEDPRLFIYRDELHVAFSRVLTLPKTHAQVGYARLKELAPAIWKVDQEFLMPSPLNREWEKNWGFFESGGHLWAVYDAARHTILAINGRDATIAYEHVGRTIPGDFGEIRGGAAPQFWRGEFYSFIHFRKPPKNYRGGLYTFDAQPPFAPTGYISYPILNPTPEHVSQQCASQVVYPAGAALLDWRWVVSYGGYDKDSRLVAYDVNEVQAAIRRKIR